MKINGITVTTPKPSVLVLPHNGRDLIIKARYVTNQELDELDKILPEPKPPTKQVVDSNGKLGPAIPDLTNEKYQEQLTKYHSQRMAWVYIKSLEATENMEWDTVNINDPETWENWHTDLERSGLPASYTIHISRLVTDTQGWNSERIDEATQNFLALAPVE